MDMASPSQRLGQLVLEHAPGGNPGARLGQILQQAANGFGRQRANRAKHPVHSRMALARAGRKVQYSK